MSERSVLVKICGIRTLEGAQAAVDAGADLLGFICHPPARRYVSPAQIVSILGSLKRRSAVKAVGVFVNQPVDVMNAIANGCGLDLLQLSGDEGDEVMALLDRPVIRVWRPMGPRREPSPLSGFAISPPEFGPAATSLTWARSAERAGPPLRPSLFAALLEPPAVGWGGTGKRLDWGIARSITVLRCRPPVFLAGGLQPENVAAAITAVLPDGVDVSSGVERDGVQDGARIAAFVAAAKGTRA